MARVHVFLLVLASFSRPSPWLRTSELSWRLACTRFTAQENARKFVPHSAHCAIVVVARPRQQCQAAAGRTGKQQHNAAEERRRRAACKKLELIIQQCRAVSSVRARGGVRSRRCGGGHGDDPPEYAQLIPPLQLPRELAESGDWCLFSLSVSSSLSLFLSQLCFSLSPSPLSFVLGKFHQNVCPTMLHRRRRTSPSPRTTHTAVAAAAGAGDMRVSSLCG